MAEDAEGDLLSYALAGADADRFTIDAGTGQLAVADGSALDYETADRHAVTVTVTDGKSAADGRDDSATDATIDVIVVVSDRDETPAPVAAATVAAVAAGRAAAGLQVTWAAPANAGSPIYDYDVQYRLAAATEWTDHAHTGADTVTTVGSLAGNTDYEVRVRARSAEGWSDWSPPFTGRTDPSNPTVTGVALVSDRVRTAPMRSATRSAYE